MKLGGALGRTFGKTHKFWVSSPAEAVRALCSQVEGFAAYMCSEERKTFYKVLVDDAQIDPEEQLHNFHNGREVRIMPFIQGAKSGGLFQVVLGAALIGLAFVPGIGTIAATGAFNALGTAAFGIGMSLSLGGIAQMLSPQPKLSIQDAPQNEPNTSLGVVNTSAQGRPVPLCYGEVMAGSAVISAGVFAADTNS
ncbi:tail assembly protein [Pusillimonas noertemannii]|nr:tail assembly protein [Pusillimonas noertemannii]TFL11060.1 tail assembly protein [Pusillimonas noertemannii]